MSDQVLIRPASILWFQGYSPLSSFLPAPRSRICSFVPAKPRNSHFLTPSPRPGDGQVQYLAGSTDDSCVLSPDSGRLSQPGQAARHAFSRALARGNRGAEGAAAGRCPGQQSVFLRGEAGVGAALVRRPRLLFSPVLSDVVTATRAGAFPGIAAAPVSAGC